MLSFWSSLPRLISFSIPTLFVLRAPFFGQERSLVETSRTTKKPRPDLVQLPVLARRQVDLSAIGLASVQPEMHVRMRRIAVQREQRASARKCGLDPGGGEVQSVASVDGIGETQDNPIVRANRPM